MRKYFIVFFGFILLFSCKKKDNHFIVTGRVLNAGNNKGISGVSVRIYDGIEFGGGVIGTGDSYEVKQNTTITDSNGYYYLELKTWKEMVSVGAYVDNENYYSDRKLSNFINAIPDGYQSNINLYLATENRIRTIAFKSKTPFDSDSVFISLPPSWSDIPIESNLKTIRSDINIVEQQFGGTYRADRYQKFTIRYKENNKTWVTKVDSFYVEGGEEIEYIEVWF